MEIAVNYQDHTPLYKQIAATIKAAIKRKEIKAGDTLPSINQLYDSLAVSKDTVKKAYAILQKEGLIEATHGKGFYVKKSKSGAYKVLILFDFINTYKKELYQAFVKPLENNAEFTIRIFNQDIDLFEKFVAENLGSYDYYVITPHLPLDDKTQRRAVTALKKIPNRKLILLDHIPQGLHGNFTSVYQDFENDIYQGLVQALPEITKYTKLNVQVMQDSLYAPLLEKGLTRFCREYAIAHELFKNKSPQSLRKGECFLILSGQLDVELTVIAELAVKQGLKIGEDIGVLSYNESPFNQIILNGLSVLSTNFRKMGETAAQFILDKTPKQIKNDFGFIKRNTI